MKPIWRVTFILGMVSLVGAQDRQRYVTGGLTLEYGEGHQMGVEIGDTLPDPYIYREHFLDLTAGYGDISVWTVFEFSSPPKIGPDYSGLYKWRLSWLGERLSLQFGDLYGHLGRGLALNLWESQVIDWDSSLRGLWLKTQPVGPLKVDLLCGFTRGGWHLPLEPGVDPRVRDFHDSTQVLAGALAMDNPIPGLTIGTYLVMLKEARPWFTLIPDFRTGEYQRVDEETVSIGSWMPGIYGEFLSRGLDFYLEVTGRDHHVGGPDSLFATALGRRVSVAGRKQGWEAFAALSFHPGRWGLVLEYKNYLLDNSDPELRRQLPLRLHRRALIQSPPTGVKEHTSILLGRQPHNIDFTDDVGIQLEGHFQVTPNLFLTANHARSSRHFGYKRVVRSDFSTYWESTELPSLFWMSASKKYYPFSEWSAEADLYWETLDLDVRAVLATSSEIIEYSEASFATGELPGHTKEIQSRVQRNLFSFPTQWTLGLPSGWGITADLEFQWEQEVSHHQISFRSEATGLVDSILTDTTVEIPYTYSYFTLSLGRSSRFALALVVDIASALKIGATRNADPGLDNPLERFLRNAGMDLSNKWVGLQLDRYLGPSTRLSLFYGSLRGGLHCESGVCVYLPGIEDAFTITLTSQF